MKKLISVILVLICMSSLVACSGGNLSAGIKEIVIPWESESGAVVEYEELIDMFNARYSYYYETASKNPVKRWYDIDLKYYIKQTQDEISIEEVYKLRGKYGVNKDNMIAMQLNLNAEMRYSYLDEQGNSIKETRTATGKIIFVNGISYSDITLKLEGSEEEEHIKVMGEGDHGFYLGNKYLYTLEDLLQIEHNFTYTSATVMAVRGHHMHNHIIDYEKSSLYDFGVESDSPSSNYTKYFLDGDTFYMEIRPDDQALIEEGDIKDQKLVVQYKGKYIKDSLASEEVDMYQRSYRKYAREVDGVSHTMIIENKKRVTFKLGTPITITAPDTTGYIQE